MPKLPPLTAVRAFEAASRHLNFTKAAEELGMTQAAVSYQIKMLEDRVGTALFVRLPRQVALTPAGARLAPQVTEAFEMLQAAFAHTGKVVDNVLSLSVLQTIASQWLVPRLGRFQMTHPQFAVQLDASHHMVDFGRDEFDLGIRSGRGDWPGLEAHLLLPSHFTPLCSPSLLQDVEIRSPADILKLPLLGPQDPWWPQWFEEAGVGPVDLSDRPDNSLRTQQFEGMAAMAGQGVALVNPFFFAADLAAGRLVQIFDLVVKADRDYWLVYPTSRRRSPKIRAFCEWILDEASRDSAQAALNEECRRA
ncbi:MAG TPA: transcriptional regulator GcvA [Microvirga sp.]|jgi:LysR family glycine cleavage system transcriptional activator